jgi:uncharacterized protein (TIGR03067 family)
VPSSAELAGKKLPADAIASWKLVIKDADYTFTSNEPIDKGTVKVDRSAKPMTMDIKGEDGPNTGKTILAIFELEGDILKVCYDVGGQKRPAELISAMRCPPGHGLPRRFGIIKITPAGRSAELGC